MVDRAVRPTIIASTPVTLQTAAETSTVSAWIDRLGLDALTRSSGLAGAIFIAASLLVLLLELRNGAGVARLRSRSFINDVLYSAFYRGGFYAVFVWAAVVNAFESHLSFLRLDLLGDLPLALSVPVFWLAGDFAIYWVHRAQHRFPLLWAFHAVHHAEQELSTLSQNRRHPIEKVVNSLTLYLPFAFVLGLPTRAWIPWWVTAQVLEAAQHAQLDWRYGPFYRVIVSPVFHSIHHSADPRHHHRNFGAMFAFWDYLFGTAEREARRPERFGVDGIVIPESLGGQLVAPFRILFRRRQPDAAAAPERAPADPSY